MLLNPPTTFHLPLLSFLLLLSIYPCSSSRDGGGGSSKSRKSSTPLYPPQPATIPTPPHHHRLSLSTINPRSTLPGGHLYSSSSSGSASGPSSSITDYAWSATLSTSSPVLLGLTTTTPNETLKKQKSTKMGGSGSSNGGVGDEIVHPKSSYSLFQIIIIAIVAVILGLLTVLGNILVMVSFKIDKQLQTISNYFLFSLAVADFIIGLVSMPLFAVYLIMGYWPFGPAICDAWLALDYLASNASVLNLLIISFDRYFSVTRPLTYRARRTTRRAAVMISSAWIISLVLWPPWIYAWPYIEGEKTVPEHECYIQFIQTNYYITFGTAIAAFYVPVSIMLVLYWQIWRETEKRQRDLSQLQAGKKDSSRRSNSSDEAMDVEEWKRMRSESCICQDHSDQVSSCPAHSRQSRLPRCCYRKWHCLRRIYLSFVRFCRVDRDQDDGEDGEDEHVSPGCGTPASIETPLQSSVSRCTSLNVIRDPLAQTPTRKTDSLVSPLQQHHHHHQQQPSQPTTTLPTGSNGKLVGNDSVYTILIRIPGETEGKNASIRMIQEPGPLPPPPIHPKAKLASSNPDHYSFRSGSPSGPTSSATPAAPLPLAPTNSSGSVNAGGSGPPGSGTPAGSTGGGGMGRRISSAVTTTLNSKLISKSLMGGKGSTTTLSGGGGSGSTTTVLPSTTKRKKKKNQEKKQEKKAAKTLSAILLAFIVTWTPYNILVLLRTVLSKDTDDPIPQTLWDMAYYLCYINSTINPMCYALCNASFRRTYVRILTCKWDNSRRQAVNRGYYN